MGRARCRADDGAVLDFCESCGAALERTCPPCGAAALAGTDNLAAPAVAERRLGRKLRHVTARDADLVVAANPGCLLGMRAGAIARRLAVTVEQVALLMLVHPR